MYSQTRPIETSSIISAYSIPACKSNYTEIKQRRPFANIGTPLITFLVERGQASISVEARQLLCVKLFDKIKILQLGDFLYVAKSNEGCTLLRNGANGIIIANSEICSILKNKFHAKQNVKCELKSTKSLFDGNQLFELCIPEFYQSFYKRRLLRHNNIQQ